MIYELYSKTRTGQKRTNLGFSTNFGRAFIMAEDFLYNNHDLEILILEVSEESLEDVDCNNWSTEEMRDRQRIVRHLVWDGGVCDA